MSSPDCRYYLRCFLLDLLWNNNLMSLNSWSIRHRITPQMILSYSLKAGFRYSIRADLIFFSRSRLITPFWL